VRLLLGTLFTLLVAAVVGLGATYLSLTRGVAFGALTIGSWTAWPKSGTTAIDPYAQSAIARIGRLPVALGDGVEFVARRDDNGRALDGRCEVTVSGMTPVARYWTLTLYTPEGALVANAINRYGFTSQEILRRADGSFQITIAPRASPGNWLPTSGIERYVLMLRLYDTSVGVSTKEGREVPMPSLTVRSCP
jgi:hypothetical protein